jgi:hypothetical protein
VEKMENDRLQKNVMEWETDSREGEADTWGHG